MRSIYTTITAAFLACGLSPAWAQTWDANKVWYAGDPGFPNTLRYVDVDGSFPGWDVGDTVAVTHQAPSVNAGGIGSLEASFFSVTNGKEKHRTGNWTFDGNGSTRTAVFWRIYVPTSALIEKLPSIQIRTHGERHHLDFDPDASGGANPKPGWVGVENTNIISGGLLKNDGSNERYLPMSMDEWHTIRVETTGASGQFAAWVDEEEGLSDVKRIDAVATKDGSGDYVEIGARSTVDFMHCWTNYLAWGQDTTATAGTNQIAPLMSPTTQIENCSNGIDDDSDGLADCDDPGCLCAPVPEDNFAACHNGVDDDLDGDIDCEDADCVGAASEDCTNARDDDCDGLVDCLDPDCGGVTECGPNEPHYELTMVRQVGEWQNGCTALTCNSVLYASVYDEFGNPLDDVRVGDPTRGVSWVTWQEPGQGPDGQHGHGRLDAILPLDGVYRLRVMSENSNPVSSDTTPLLFATPDGSPSGKPQYSWQVEFMRKTKRVNAGTFAPEDPCYIFDGVELNPASGVNTTLDDDFSDLHTGGGDGFVQTFVPDGHRVISARFELTIGFLATFRYQVSIHPLLNDPPTSIADLGPQIGATKMGPANMIDSEWWTQMLVWPMEGPDAVIVEPGTKYAALVTRADPANLSYPFLNGFITDGNYFPNGQVYRQPTGTSDLVNDSSNYDLTGYIVCASVPKCSANPVYDVAGGGGLGDEPDGMLDTLDFGVFLSCATGPTPDPTLFDEEHINYIGDTCSCMDLNEDNAIDQTDFAAFQRCIGLTGNALTDCDD